jgi:hypothetical protein
MGCPGMILGGSLVGSLGKIPLVKPLGGIPGGYMREIPGGEGIPGEIPGEISGGGSLGVSTGGPQGIISPGGNPWGSKVGGGA